jgi:mannose-6-phosphate isomerase
VLYPFTFKPIFKERVWGGRELARLYGKPLPPGAVIGESWEISDRPGDVSVIANGPLAGKDLHWLMENHARELIGAARPAGENRFPLLIKILDAQEKLSLQVHPPAGRAAELKGEPKTEMWFIADAAPGAELFAGLKQGVTRAQFEEKISDGSVAECFHRVPVRAGDTMFLPSGRVHAIGSGLVIFEIQQNSDTTYRVFDWNRAGLDGKLRELHVALSLASIDFNDFEPELVEAKSGSGPNFKFRQLAQNALFNVCEMTVETAESILMREQQMRIIAVVKGAVTVAGAGNESPVELLPGQFCLIPASLKAVELAARPVTTILCIEAN